MAMMPEMPGMAPKISPVRMPRAMAPMEGRVKTEMSPVQMSASMCSSGGALLEQDALGQDDLHEMHGHIVKQQREQDVEHQAGQPALQAQHE